MHTPLAKQIAEVKREIAMRESVYPPRVYRKQMEQEQADRQLATMRAVLRTLERVRDGGQQTLGFD